MIKPDLKMLQVKLGVTFSNQHLLKQAFTHSSYANEHRHELQDNERLEFLGDAILSLTVSDFLYHNFPQYSEGLLTKMRASIVCEPTLVKFAIKLEFNKYIFLGRGEEATGGRNRPSLLADVFEAFLGALFIDQGLPGVLHFMKTYIFPILQSDPIVYYADYKTMLQEHVQHQRLGTLTYEISNEQGPSHDKQFVAEVLIEHVLHGRGEGRNKKEAEQQAALQALRKFAIVN
jgi:ribonuclease-3